MSGASDHARQLAFGARTRRGRDVGSHACSACSTSTWTSSFTTSRTGATARDGRLDEEDFPAWSLEDALAFLIDRCGLTEARPGFVVEHHGELYGRWRDAIDAGVLRAPFHVTHVDAHADLGLGDCGFIHLLRDLVFREVADRRDPGEALNDSNYLAFAIGCRWLGELDYVYNRDDPRGEGPGDILACLMEGFAPRATNIQLPALTVDQLWDLPMFRERPQPAHLEPPVPFRAVPWRHYRATAAFDVVCLARSPEYTPAACDALFDAIRQRFIVELAPAP